MALKTTSLVRRLGWGGFFRLLTHLPSFLKLFSRLAKDSRVLPGAKLVLVGILVYLVLPTDLIPDFLPVMGQLDDLAVILGGLKLFLRLCPADVVQQHVKALAAGK
ncbi:MAG: YkvA family protein [Candidatus Binatia bacterium]